MMMLINDEVEGMRELANIGQVTKIRNTDLQSVSQTQYVYAVSGIIKC